MNQIERRLRAAVNPLSTAATRWWCSSAARQTLTGYGPTTRQRRLAGHGVRAAAGFTPSGGQVQARAGAVDDLLGWPAEELVGVTVAAACSSLGDRCGIDCDGQVS